jgi:hypothetical protein
MKEGLSLPPPLLHRRVAARCIVTDETVLKNPRCGRCTVCGAEYGRCAPRRDPVRTGHAASLAPY